MAKQIGLVIRADPQGATEVLTERRNACGGCEASQGCKTCLTTSKIKAKVNNPIEARTGDLVEIQMASGAVYQGAAILYGLPLICLVVGAFSGAAWFAGESVAAVGGGGIGFAVGLALAVWLGNTAYAKTHLLPTIVRIVASAVPRSPQSISAQTDAELSGTTPVE